MTAARPAGPPRLAPLLAVAILLLLRVADPIPVERLRLAFFDLAQRLAPREADAGLRPVVIVDVDEESLSRLGQWPWPREVLARLVDRLAERSPAVVAFDFLFAEPDRFGGDAALAESLGRTPSVLATVPGTPGVHALEAKALGLGSIGALPERDGVVRRVPVPGFAVEALRVAAGDPAMRTRPGTVETGGFTIPVDADGRAWIRFSAHAPWRFVPAADVLEGRAAIPESRIVLVGATASGLGDVVATPVEPAMAGIEVHAQAIENALSGSFLRRPRWATAAELAAALVAGVALALAPRRASGLVVLPILGVAAFASGLLLDPVWPALTGLGGWGVAIAASFEHERRRALRLEGEMRAAREIQMAMLPDLGSIGVAGFRVAGALLPAKAVGGDFYDVVRLDDRRVFLLVGDVSGKGAPAALFMALVKTLCRSLALRGGAVEEGIRAADREIEAQNPAMMFATLLAGVLDVGTGEFRWVSAGHEAPIVLEPGEAPRRLEGEAGPPLGALSGFPYACARATLAPGSMLVMLTDGVSDAVDARGERFTSGRAMEALRDAADPEDAVRRLLEEVHAFEGEAEAADDVTVLAVAWLNGR